MPEKDYSSWKMPVTEYVDTNGFKKFISQRVIGYQSIGGGKSLAVYECEIEYTDGKQVTCWVVVESGGERGLDFLHTTKPEIDIPKQE